MSERPSLPEAAEAFNQAMAEAGRVLLRSMVDMTRSWDMANQFRLRECTFQRWHRQVTRHGR